MTIASTLVAKPVKRILIKVDKTSKIYSVPIDSSKDSKRLQRLAFEDIRCKIYHNISSSLLEILWDLQNQTKSLMVLYSGYRTPQTNRKVHGKSKSYHLRGMAADISFELYDIHVIHKLAHNTIGKRGGLGYYPSRGFIHVDSRGYPARWVN